MDITAEKQEVIKRINLVNDADTIIAIRYILDHTLPGEEENDAALHASIARGLSECEQGLCRPHEEVMADLRKRYNL